MSAALNAPTNPTDQTKVPHYFGPYPNWANSPQVLSNALVDISVGTPTPTSFGNALVDRKYATDYATPTGTLGPGLGRHSLIAVYNGGAGFKLSTSKSNTQTMK